MDFKQFHSINLKHCPCVMESFEDDIYVIGTYELDEEKSNQGIPSYDNNRKGSLAFVKDMNLVIESSCPDGGVFDLKVFEKKVIAAHANGKICSYEYENDDFRQIGSFSTESNMLTSIDYISLEQNILIIASDSNGYAFSFLTNKELELNTVEAFDSTKLSSTNDPIWRVKLFCLNDECMLISGSDDCHLRLNHVHGEKIGEKPTCTRKDALAGVTSIEVISESESLTVYCGSYDEHLRIYEVQTALDSGQVDLFLLKVIRIPDAGIWKTRTCQGFQLIVGMYAGVTIKTTSDQKTAYVINKFDSIVDESNSQQHLIYDAIVGKSFENIIVASFYKKEIYVFQKVENP